MKMQAAAISHILVSNCSFIPILGPTLPPDLFACWWCPCGVTWDAYPWQLWLLKLLLKPAFHFFYLQAGACQWTTVMVTNYSWDNLQGDNTDKQLTSVSKSGLWSLEGYPFFSYNTTGFAPLLHFIERSAILTHVSAQKVCYLLFESFSLWWVAVQARTKSSIYLQNLSTKPFPAWT